LTLVLQTGNLGKRLLMPLFAFKALLALAKMA
jgi:hypothetical protein